MKSTRFTTIVAALALASVWSVEAPQGGEDSKSGTTWIGGVQVVF